jgi:hypothetical protein
VTRYRHITNMCEMYFGRFYEFRERMKKYLKVIKNAEPKHSLEIVKIINLFDKVFDQELRNRNRVHHDSRFEDIAIDRAFVIETFSMSHDDKGWKREQLIAYRKLASEWARRVRQRGAKLKWSTVFWLVAISFPSQHC